MDQGEENRLSTTIRYGRRKVMKNEEESRNWLGLPVDIMIQIFSKLDLVDILFRAQFVCSYWLQNAKDPQIFRSIRVPNSATGIKLFKVAVDRSCGQLTEILLENGASFCDELLHYVSLTPNLLISLRLATCGGEITGEGLVKACRKLPLLEELEFTNTSFDISCLDIVHVGESCRRLKYLGIFGKCGHRSKPFYEDELVFSIAENMPRLERLRLYSTALTNRGLQAIFTGCPRLEGLDLQDCCFLDDVEGTSLLEKYRHRIKDLTLPSGLVTPDQASRHIANVMKCHLMNRRRTGNGNYGQV